MNDVQSLKNQIDRIANRLDEAQHTIRDLLVALEELISTVDDCARDDYVPDSFTTRPAKRVVRKLRKCSDAKER